MRSDRFGNPANSMRLLARVLHRRPGNVVADSIAREEPLLGLVDWPPAAQDLQQLWGKHDIAIFLPLCVARIYVAMVSQLPAVKASS
jgi:hypothetical protein